MTSASADVPVSDHQFGIFDESEIPIPIESANYSNGLIVTMSVGCTIHTGADRGRVAVTVEVLDAPPRMIDAGPWEDIVEASIQCHHGALRIQPLDRMMHATPPLPPLSIRGPGNYRLRAHAYARDLHYDKVQMEPTERYLLTTWPAEHQPDLIIRATDQCGYGLRLANLARQTE
jgi:hypothetical protein